MLSANLWLLVQRVQLLHLLVESELAGNEILTGSRLLEGIIFLVPPDRRILMVHFSLAISTAFIMVVCESVLGFCPHCWEHGAAVMTVCSSSFDAGII